MTTPAFLVGAAPIVLAAFVIGVITVALTLLVLLATIVMRAVSLREERIDGQARQTWRPILCASPEAPIPSLPELKGRELPGFLEVWNEAHATLGAAATARLVAIAGQLGLAGRLRRFLRSRSFHRRALAVIALGYPGDEGARESLIAMLHDRSPVLSLCAARSLMLINAREAMPVLLPLILERRVWTPDVVSAILSEGDPGVVAQPLAEATLHATSEMAPRLLRFLAGVDPAAAAPVVRRLLATTDDPTMISTCLQVLTRAVDLDIVRPMLTHREWFVRLQAVNAVGRLGAAGDVDLLLPLLADRYWWVRYRAAQALLRLPQITLESAQQIRGGQTDRYARDILEQVITEHALGASA